MFPYLAMLAVPGLLALTGSRRAPIILFLVALLYWVMVGFRFQVGSEWMLSICGRILSMPVATRVDWKKGNMALGK